MLGCFCRLRGGGSDYVDSEQTESLNDDTSGEDTGSEDTGSYDLNEEGRGVANSGTIKLTIKYFYGMSYYFYARTCEGKYSDGRLKMGNWVMLASKRHPNTPTAENGATLLSSNKDAREEVFSIDKAKKYVEFAYEYGTYNDVFFTTADWYYSGKFWSTKDSARETVNTITLDHTGGLSKNIPLRITVNNTKVLDYNGNRRKDFVPRYYFKNGNKIRVNTYKTSDYSNTATRFYARKSAESLWVLLLDKTNGDHQLDIDDDYVEFGFEFDIVGGVNWPYSKVFWKAEQSMEDPVDNIFIYMDGTSLNPDLHIYVNMNQCDKIYPKNLSKRPYYFKQRNEIRIKTWKTGLYSNKATRLYGRKSAGGIWTCLLDKTDGDHEIYIPDNSGYVEYGFEFDILGGTDWPYSNRFWTAEDSAREKLEDIYVEMNGTSINASIAIWVNGQRKVNDSNCKSHFQYYWKTSNNIRIKTYKTSAYRVNAQRIYARKSSGSKWDIVLDETNGDHEKLIDDDYIEFGFEFDVQGGRDWPYSRPFWTASDSAKTKVEDIYIEMTGTWIWKVDLDIYVNSKNIYSNTNLSSGSQYIWKRWEGTRIRTYKTSAYRLKAQRVYASNPGQGWTCVLDEKNGDHTTYVSGYTEFGFEFDIEAGTDWPFSRPFWYGSAPDDIYIEMTGEIRTADLKIQVDGNTIYDNTNLSKGSRYNW